MSVVRTKPDSSRTSMSQLNRGDRSRILYIESKGGGLEGPARIGRVTFSKSGRTLYYRGRTFRSLSGRGFKANFFDIETGEAFWISGPRRDGADRLYDGGARVEIDDDVRVEYWTNVRGEPARVQDRVT